MSPYLPSLAGGALIGLSAALLMLLNGRVAGISGLVAGLGRPGGRWPADLAFLVGLVLGPPLFARLSGHWPEMRIAAGMPALAVAGLLVGFGTRMGAGCTSGHGVCGLARLSTRSLVAVLTFLASGVLTVAAGHLMPVAEQHGPFPRSEGGASPPAWRIALDASASRAAGTTP